ncbi:MAG: hypothetical protein V1835_05695 [Candidatus Micrarchaeota archaeon]
MGLSPREFSELVALKQTREGEHRKIKASQATLDRLVGSGLMVRRNASIMGKPLALYSPTGKGKLHRAALREKASVAGKFGLAVTFRSWKV